MISTRTRPVRRSSYLAMLVITAVAVLAFGSSAAQAMPADGGTSTNPWIQSDQLDYAPGSTVTLSGGNWQPGESVHVFVDDTNGHTWNHSADVTADENGAIQDVFDLPTSFVAIYDVTATGDASGVATTTFTDGNVNVKSVGVGTAPVSYRLFSTTNCTGASTTGSITATNSGNGTAIPGGASATQSLQLTAGAVSGATFSSWSNGNFTTGDPSTANPVCLVGAGNTQNIMVNYTTLTATTLAVAPATGTFAGTVNLSATLTAGSGVSGKTVTFSLNGTAVCGGSTGTTCPTTNGSGVATLNNVSLSGINAGTYATGVAASFAGDSTFAASSGSAQLTVNKASSSTVVTCPVSVTYNGSAQTPCSANVTGAGGLSQSLTVNYSANINAGTATASASYAGDTNHLPSSDSKTFAIAKASSTTVVTCPVSVTYNGSPQTPCSAHVTGAGGLNQSVTVSHSANTNAGTATATATFAGDSNHNGSTDSKTFTIAKASSTTVVTCPVSVTYNGSAQTPCSASVTGAGGLNQSLTVSYSANTDAGTATASASYAGDANHDPSSDSKTFTIDKASSTTSVSCPVSVTFNGSAQEPCSASVIGAGGLNQSLSVSYSDNTNAGTATASASYGGDANHTSSSDSKTFAIEKAEPTVSITLGGSADLRRRSPPGDRLGERCRLAFRGSREPRPHLLQRPERDRHAAGGCADRCRHLHGAGELRRQRELHLGLGHQDDHDREGRLDHLGDLSRQRDLHRVGPGAVLGRA